MIRVILMAALLLAALAIFTVQPTAVAQSDQNKVDICHVPPGNLENGHIITVDAEAWEHGHSEHNSHIYDGLCSGPEGPDDNCRLYCLGGPVLY
jgi:hypothetical protein